MNIRRGFLALAAMILGVGFLGAFPQQAHATVVACQPTNPTQSQFPYGNWTMRCGTVLTAAEGQQMSGMVNSITGQTKQELARANNGNLPDANGRPLNGVRFFLFENPQDYIDSAATLGLSPVAVDNYAFSVVKFDANNVPVYAAVFKRNKGGRTFTNAIRNGTATAAARAGDYLQGYVKNGGILPPVNYRLSDTGAGFRSMFEQNLEVDFAAINNPAVLPCKNPTTMANGLFSGYSDKDGIFICNGINGNGTALIPAYAGLNNRQALNKAWPHIFPLAPGAIGTAPVDYYAGFFAELYAAKVVSGAVDTTTVGQTQDAYFNKGFECTIWFAQNIPNQGFLDNNTMPVGCVDPTSIMTTKCRKLFTGNSGQFPNGNIFNCTNPSTVIASQVQQKLEGLGRLGTPAKDVTNIKSEFSRIRTQVFVFTDLAAYNAAFTAANEPVAGGLANAVAGTYPNFMWYTIMFGSLSGTSGQSAYTATHELAHALDFEPAQQSALANYNTAMQHDWQNLDYVSFPSTPRNPCGSVTLDGYKGPLVGIIDPNTSQTFCNGNALRPSASWPANAKASQVLLHSTTFGKKDFPLTYQPLVPGPIGQHVPTIANKEPGWREWHSEAFAIVSSDDVVSTAPTLKTVYPTLVSNGYFQCTAGPSASASWAFNEYSTGAPANAPAACLTALPGWTEIKLTL